MNSPFFWWWDSRVPRHDYGQVTDHLGAKNWQTYSLSYQSLLFLCLLWWGLTNCPFYCTAAWWMSIDDKLERMVHFPKSKYFTLIDGFHFPKNLFAGECHTFLTLWIMTLLRRHNSPISFYRKLSTKVRLPHMFRRLKNYSLLTQVKLVVSWKYCTCHHLWLFVNQSTMQRNNSQFVTATISIAFAHKTVSIYPFILFQMIKINIARSFGTLFIVFPSTN